jgi:DNA-directed RNA polymerase specialized sigma24 family protein
MTLGRPENTVKTWLHRSLAKLRRELDSAAPSEARFLD